MAISNTDINSKKKAPILKEYPEIQLAFNRVYDQINELYDGVNTQANESFSAGSGKPGNLRVGKKSNRSVSIEVRTDEGWFESQIFTSNPNVTKLTDSTDGTVVTTIPNTTGVDIAASTGTQVPTVAEFEKAVASLSAKLNEVIVIINNMNPSGFKMIEKRR